MARVSSPPATGIQQFQYVVFFVATCYSQVWDFITFWMVQVRGKLSAMESCSWIELSKNVWHEAIAPKGCPPIAKCCIFGLFFLHSHFPGFHTLLLPSALCSLIPPHILPRPSPWTRVWTRNFAISDRIRSASWKHMNARLVRGTFLTCTFVRPSVHLFVNKLWTRYFENEWTDFNANWHKSSPEQGRATVNLIV